jgi:hypothetical protein
MLRVRSCAICLAAVTSICATAAIARPISWVTPARARTAATRPSGAQRSSRQASRIGPATTAADAVLLGADAVASAIGSVPAGWPESFRVTGRRSGSVSSIYVYIDSHNRATGLIAGLYSNENGHPGSLLTAGALIHPKAHAWNRLHVRLASVWSGHIYWLAVLGRGGRLYFRVGRNGRCSTEKALKTRLRALRPSWTGQREDSICRISAFAARKVANGVFESVLSTSGGGASNASPPSAGGAASTPAGATTASNVLSLPVLAPVNIGFPAVSGTPTEGQILTTSNGSWLNTPAQYIYAWQHCDSAVLHCTTIGGATSSSYRLQAGDVGSTIRSVVTASNSGGSASATSLPTSQVAASPSPAASFSYSPTAPVTGQSVRFDGTATTCAASPCTYTWADDPPSGGSWPLGSGEAIDFTFSVAGTKYVTLSVTDTLNRTSTTEHSVVVTAGLPTDSSQPTIAGTTQQGQTLTSSTGSWTGNPTSYAYQWMDCGSSGNNCANINGATSSGYTLAQSDVGQTIRVAVTATNASGSASATSAPTGVVQSSGSGSAGCDLNATPSNFAAQVAAASPGQVVCLASGDYGSWPGTSKSAPGITVTAAPGATVNFSGGLQISNLANAQNFTLDGSAGGGTMTLAGGEVQGNTTTARNITLQNLALTAPLSIDGATNANIVLNAITAFNINDTDPVNCTGSSYRLGGSASGVTLENSIIGGGDLDGSQISGTWTIKDNVYADLYEPNSDCQHTDSIQLDIGNTGRNVVTGNFFYGSPDGFVAYDGTSDNTFTDNACYGLWAGHPGCVTLYDDTGSVVNHNTGGSGYAFELSSKTNCGSGTVSENNVGQNIGSCESSLATNTDNLFPGASPPNLNGSPTFVGGASPTTWAGFELASCSAPTSCLGNDGVNVGIRASAGGPPVGNSELLSNTAAPSISGTPTVGDTLTASPGTWTNPNTIPYGFLYQWEDCDVSGNNCTNVAQNGAGPVDAGRAPTYLVQSGDAGHTLRVVVSAVNAAGQATATSAAAGPA